eukprot:TRINITY_DN2140_c0_g1_i1.p1 TRINITY_DN2140_c0_g1~~TRINITY_DN2140_c0_g1_i1.p1  ORF type:complete len:177 (+),score=33.33 TRINITY_DN2140_c0_g1_i1:238-768(+)
MGQHHSFSYEELEKLQEGTTFTPHQILKLHKRFKKIDADGNGEISREEFNSIPGLAANPLLERVLAIFDTDNSQTVDFREFVKALAIFSGDCAKLDKLKFTFKVYDLDGDGFISNADLFKTLHVMVGANLTDQQLQQVVDKTILEADTDKDGLISFEEFERCVEHSDFGDKLTLKF